MNSRNVKRKGFGRPPLSKTEVSTNCGFRIPTSEKEKINKLCNAERMTFSELMQFLVRNYLAKAKL